MDRALIWMRDTLVSVPLGTQACHVKRTLMSVLLIHVLMVDPVLRVLQTFLGLCQHRENFFVSVHLITLV